MNNLEVRVIASCNKLDTTRKSIKRILHDFTLKIELKK